MRPRGPATAGNVDLVGALAHPFRRDDGAAVLDIAEADGAAKSRREHARSDAADQLSLAKHRLVVEQQRRRVFEDELREPPPRAGFPLAQQGFAADEIAALVNFYGEAQPRLVGRVLLGDV